MRHINRVALVGHCGMDSHMLSDTVRQAMGPEIQLTTAHSTQELEGELSAGALLLINRQLDGRFATSNGVELISSLMALTEPPVLMLISNYPEAQNQAMKAGAQRGFGKSQLGTPQTTALLRQTLRPSSPQSA